MSFVNPTYAFICVGGLVFILALLWPANARRWGGDEVPRSARPDPVWEPWAYTSEYVEVGPGAPPPATYSVGEVETPLELSPTRHLHLVRGDDS